MLVLLIIAAVVAVGLAVGLVLSRRQIARLTAEGEERAERLERTSDELGRNKESLRDTMENLADTRAELRDTRSERAELNGRLDELQQHLDEVRDSFRKRTELADTRAEQLEVLGAERDDLRERLEAAEEQILILTARPGVVVGDSTDDPDFDTLWDLEMARSERSWRNSVAIDPSGDPSPFEGSDDPVRTAVEIEAAALREDVGALIGIDWKATPIESPSRRMLVLRVAQELLAQASRAPGAARLVVTDGDDGSLRFGFETDEPDGGVALNLVPPPVSASDVVDYEVEDGLMVVVRAERPELDETADAAGQSA